MPLTSSDKSGIAILVFRGAASGSDYLYLKSRPFTPPTLSKHPYGYGQITLTEAARQDI